MTTCTLAAEVLCHQKAPTKGTLPRWQLIQIYVNIQSASYDEGVDAFNPCTIIPRWSSPPKRNDPEEHRMQKDKLQYRWGNLSYITAHFFFFFLVLPPGRITGYGPAPAQQCFVWPTINIFQSTTLDAAQVSSRGIVLFRNRLKSGVELLLLLLNKVACRVVQTSRKLPVWWTVDRNGEGRNLGSVV